LRERLGMNTSPLTRPFSDEYLHSYSHEHVYYEFDMMLELASNLEAGLPIESAVPGRAEFLMMALLESWVLHVRNVIDFLYPVRPRETDVIAADFHQEGAWSALCPTISSSLQEAKRRADKELAHMTTGRIAGTPPEKVWEVSALAAELTPLMRLFADKAVASRLSPRVGSRLAPR
jgi:hypothetical protein